MNNLDLNLYSRQIYTLGMETMKKLINLNIFIIGVQGLGVEISKNIILSGPKKVIIFDDKIVELSDLGSNFYLTKEDVNNKRRDEACLKKLQENNSYVEVEISTDFNKLQGSGRQRRHLGLHHRNQSRPRPLAAQGEDGGLRPLRHFAEEFYG